MNHACRTCDRWFVSWDAAKQHMDALHHWPFENEFACDKCDRTFTTQDACNQHMTALRHWYTNKCDTCQKRFVNKQAAEQHMDALSHRSIPFCSSCKRRFESLADLDRHMDSPIHLRADPIHIAPVPPASLAPVSRPTPVSAPASPAVVPRPTPSATNPFRASLQPVVATPIVTPAPADITAPLTNHVKPATPCTFWAQNDPYSSEVWHFQSITSLPLYQDFSFEELRLVNQKAGCNPLTVSSQTRPSGQSTVPVTACNPRAASFQPTRPVASTSATGPSIASVSSTTPTNPWARSRQGCVSGPIHPSRHAESSAIVGLCFDQLFSSQYTRSRHRQFWKHHREPDFFVERDQIPAHRTCCET